MFGEFLGIITVGTWEIHLHSYRVQSFVTRKEPALCANLDDVHFLVTSSRLKLVTSMQSISFWPLHRQSSTKKLASELERGAASLLAQVIGSADEGRRGTAPRREDSLPGPPTTEH
eukprot:6180965-Pleurochrysis_carterae.AAC.1